MLVSLHKFCVWEVGRREVDLASPPRIPLPYFVRVLTLVRRDKLGWSARTFRRYVTPSKDEIDAEG